MNKRIMGTVIAAKAATVLLAIVVYRSASPVGLASLIQRFHVLYPPLAADVETPIAWEPLPPLKRRRFSIIPDP